MKLTQAEKIAQGINVIREFEPPGNIGLRISDCVATLQGDGPFSGLPAVVLRLSGCDSACVWCDAVWDDYADPRVPYADIIERMLNKWDKCMGPQVQPLFVLTGGEPLRQDIEPLVLGLKEASPLALVQVETSGSFFREVCAEDYVTVVVSPKTNFVHPETARAAAAYKYVIRSTDKFHSETGIPLTSTQSADGKDTVIALPPRHLPPEKIYLQPCLETDDARTAANAHKCYELSMKFGYRTSLLVNRYLGLP